MEGVIKFLIHVRGYGIVTDENGDDRFLHVTNLEDINEWLALRTGQRICFEPIQREEDRAKQNKLGVRKVRTL